MVLPQQANRGAPVAWAMIAQVPLALAETATDACHGVFKNCRLDP